MKYLLLILLTASFVASCSDWVPEADKNEREEYEKLQALQKADAFSPTRIVLLPAFVCGMLQAQCACWGNKSN